MQATLDFLSRKALGKQDPSIQNIFQDLQGNILKSHGRTFVAILFLSFTDTHKAREWLKNFSPKVTSFADQLRQTSDWKEANKKEPTQGEIFISFMLSGGGYIALNVHSHSIPSSSKFTKGMASRNTKLHDPPISDWEPTFNGSSPLHAAILVAHDGEKELQVEVGEIESNLQLFSIHVLGRQYGKRRVRELEERVQQTDEVNSPPLPNPNFPERRNNVQVDTEPFGYADGVSQPLFLKEDVEKYQAAQYTKKFWDPSVEVRVVLLSDPGGGATSYGSYCVLRKLEQDVSGFNQAVVTLANSMNVTPALVGAQIIGRFKDGTPVALSDHPLGTLPQNNFNYEDDFRGKYCPVFSHIRKANPRSVLFNVRIARRGIPYEEQTLDGKKEGLLFMSMQADLDQFETIQATWINNELFPFGRLPTPGTDPLIGQPPTENRFPLEWGSNRPRHEHTQKRFVTMRGGEYFFLPSKTTLEKIANNQI